MEIKADTRWRVAWTSADNGDVVMDCPGGELGKHGAREAALHVAGVFGRENVRVQKNDGDGWVDA